MWRAGQNAGRDKSHDGAKGARWPLDSSFPGHLARYTTVTSHVHSEKRRLTRVLLSARSLYQACASAFTRAIVASPNL